MKRNFVLILCLISLSLTACLQGPWSYRPEEKEIDRGITVEAYIVAGRPLNQVCFERLYSLDETYTSAFAFFDSAMVTIRGNFGSGTETIELSPKPGDPMCFLGPDAKVGQASEAYTLEGVFWWDSAGSAVRSEVRGSTTIPTFAQMDTLAWVNSMALSQNLGAGNQEGILGLFNSLPDTVAMFFTEKYLPELLPIAEDSAALEDWYKTKGPQIMKELDSLLTEYEELVQYTEGDTVAYLDGALNTKSHYYKMRASDDVGGILITQRLDSNGFMPRNRFDEIAEQFMELGPKNYYYPSRIRRLIYYSRFRNEKFDIVDSIPVVNTWFHSGRNIIYFYATDENYERYVNTTILEESNSKVKKADFIEGGNGFFSGMLVDSFVVYIRIPSNVKSYHITEAHAAWCADQDWDLANCRDYRFEYCRLTHYNDRQYQFDHPDLFVEFKSYISCFEMLAYDGMNNGQTVSEAFDSIYPLGQVAFKYLSDEGVNDSAIVISTEEVEEAQKWAEEYTCIEKGFESEFCNQYIDDCQTGGVDNRCYDMAKSYCLDNEWRGPTCGWVLHLYCQQPDIHSEILCGKRNNNYCELNPQDEICKK